jgi:DNA-binding transcriptional MerR regulator
LQAKLLASYLDAGACQLDLKIFTTEKVARILGVPEWRVVRFAQTGAYGIKPALADATGPGSRRLYNLENVCEIALALWLTQAGLRIEVIGRALKKARVEGLSHYLNLPWNKAKNTYLAVVRAPKGKITGQEGVVIQSWEQLEKIFNRDSDSSALIIPIGVQFMLLNRRLDEPE